MEMTLEQAIRILDGFFNEDDGINASIPVRLAWRKVRAAIRGVPEEEIEVPETIDGYGWDQL